MTNTTASPITFMTMDACGRILQSDGDEMVPTGGLVQVIPAEVLKPSDLVRQREILGACLEQHPTYLIGHEVHKWIPEWDAVARARVIDYDSDDKLWGIKYDSDHKTEDLNAEEMMKWVVHRENGDSKPDGGLGSLEGSR